MLENSKIDYFNPVVENWNEEAQAEEERQKWEECDIHLYYITPQMKGFFSLIELMDSMAQNTFAVFAYHRDGFDEQQLKSLVAIDNLIKKRYQKKCILISKRYEEEVTKEIVKVLNWLNSDD